MIPDRIGLADDGFGNLLQEVGSWYHEEANKHVPVPEGHIRSNHAAARCFYFEHWHQLLNPPRQRTFKGMDFDR